MALSDSMALPLHTPPSVRVARALSGAVLVLLSLSICTNSAEAHESEGEPSSSTPDFRFKQPRVTLGIRAGASFNRSKGDIYDFFSEELTLGDSDFDSGVFAFDVGVWVTERIDVVFGFEASGDYQKSEFRSFEEDNGNAIEQKTRLTQIPLTISAKLYPLGRGRKVGDYAWIRSRLVPYLGGGIGTTYYQLKQKGDFVDFMDLTIFESKLESEDWGFSQHVFVGLDIKLTRNFGLVFEGRYYWADADLEGDFSDFDSIDLDGARAMAGLSWRL